MLAEELGGTIRWLCQRWGGARYVVGPRMYLHEAWGTEIRYKRFWYVLLFLLGRRGRGYELDVDVVVEYVPGGMYPGYHVKSNTNQRMKWGNVSTSSGTAPV